MSGHNWQESADWARVASYVRAERNALGLRQKATEASASTWTNIENAKQASYKDFNLAQVERDLRWPAGTIRTIAGGGEPPLRSGGRTTDDDDPTLAALSGDTSLAEEDRRYVMDLVKRLRGRTGGSSCRTPSAPPPPCTSTAAWWPSGSGRRSAT